MTAAEKKIRETLGLTIMGEGKKNYSVKAGAGGGKTTMLSKRISQQILLGTPIEDFVIITYTNAAAAELREKITNQLHHLAEDGIADPNQLSNVKKAMNSIELMQISTIHAFLFKILREYAFEAGIALDARMLEDSEDEDRKQKFFDEWYGDPKHFAEIISYANDWKIMLKTSMREIDYTYDVFKNMFFDVANIREELVYDTSDHAAIITANAAKYIATWLPLLHTVRDVIEKNNIKPDKKPRKLNKKAQTVFDNINIVDAVAEKGIEEAKKIVESLENIRSIVMKGDNVFGNCKELLTDLDDALDDVVHAINDCKAEWEWNFNTYYEMALDAQKAAKVVEYVTKMQKEYQKQIDAETLVLSNDDILYRAEMLLTKHPDILDKLRERYTKIYVDEFQDTTGLQTRIIKLLTENALSEDKLLVVGDPKQSIYRFTGAEKAVYDEMDGLLSALPNSLAESVTLDSNFRSNSDIVNWVNKSFRQLIPGYTDMDTDWSVSEKNAMHGVYKYGQTTSYSKDEDVEAVTELVKKIVGQSNIFIEECVRNKDGSLGTSYLRMIEYSDIMIICKNTTNMVNYVERFASEGIPVNVQGKFKVDKDEILKNFVILVEYFANYKNKKNRIAAAQVLQSIDATQVSDDCLKESENQLRNIRKYFKDHEMDSDAKIQYLLLHEELYVPKNIEKSEEKVRAYRIRLHQMVETCVSKNDGDLSKMAYLLNAYLNRVVKREIPLESNENAVRLMNVHQSKGLTGKIVIIADRSVGEGCRYNAFRKAGKYYPAVRYSSSYGLQKSKIIPAYGYDLDILKQTYIDETEEAIRLQYVAATRAAHALIIMPVAAAKSVPWFTDFAYGYHNLKDIDEWITARKEDETVYPLNGKTASSNHRIIRLDELQMNMKAANLIEMTKKQCISITPSGLEPAGMTGYNPKDLEYHKEARPGGNVFGTVMHRVYQLLFERYDDLSALSGLEREKTIERAINQAILESLDDLREEDKPKNFADYLKMKMQEYFDKIITPIMKSADEIYPEYTFSFFVDDADRALFLKKFDFYFKNAKDEIVIFDELIWVNGQADLVVKQKDGSIKVYDYKSDARNGKSLDDFEKALEQKYEGQLMLYKYAISKAFEVDTVDTELIHLYR